MTATVIESKLKNGTLTIDGKSFSCQATNVRIVPPKRPSTGGKKSDEVLCGIVLPEDTGADSWTLSVKAVQDFTNPAGFIALTWDKQGERVPFTWAPGGTGTGTVTFSGELTLWPVEAGGEVNTRLYTTAEFALAAKPTVTRA